MEQDYMQIVSDMAQQVFDAMAPRVTSEDMERIRKAFELARHAHAPQVRKSGEPYIIHPVSVALIAASELKLDANTVITAFLHDVVEDTPYTIEDIRQMFGEDVANLVDVVTKRKKAEYHTTKQVDNYQQILDSLHYDIRAVMVKISDRLHNMRTLSSMRVDKQMKIAGETDFFYAPLANRLGLFDVKSDLENLSFKYRCELQYGDIEKDIKRHKEENKQRLNELCHDIKGILKDHGIQCSVEPHYRLPYSIYRRMNKENVDFRHISNPYYIRITFWDDTMDNPLCDKQTCLKIYSLLTNSYREKPNSFVNQIDQEKENTYQCLKTVLLSPGGIWEDIQICSKEMVEASQIGCIAELGSNIGNWVKRFRTILQDIARHGMEDKLLEYVSTTLYYDDITVYSQDGRKMILPKDSTAIDYAFKLGVSTGMHAHYAWINNELKSIKTPLQNGDCVRIVTSHNIHPRKDWVNHCCTYIAKSNLHMYNNEIKTLHGSTERCPICKPLPGGEIIGIRMNGISDITDGQEHIVIHRRSCKEAILLASKYGDNVVSVAESEFCKRDTRYPITLQIKAIDRYHFLSDLIAEITDTLHLDIDSLHTTTTDCIVDCKVTFLAKSVQDLVQAMQSIYALEGVEYVNQIHE